MLIPWVVQVPFKPWLFQHCQRKFRAPKLGFLGSPRTAAIAQFSNAQLAPLASVPPEQVAELDLRQAGLADAALQPVLKHFTALIRLHLDRNKLTDASIQELRPLANLEVLDLYGNAGITDRASDTLAAMKSLKRAFVWNTGMTPEGVLKLRKTRPDLTVNFGDVPGPAAADPPATAGRQ